MTTTADRCLNTELFRDEQADALERCLALGMSSKALAEVIGCDPRHARRMVIGQSELGGFHLWRFLRLVEGRQRYPLVDLLTHGTGLVVVDVEAEQAGDAEAEVDAGTADMLQQLSEMVRMRAEHRADQVLDAAELEAERALWLQLLRRGQAVYAALVQQRGVVRRAAHRDRPGTLRLAEADIPGVPVAGDEDDNQAAGAAT